MTPQQLRQGLYWLSERLYDARRAQARREQFFAGLRRRSPAPIPIVPVVPAPNRQLLPILGQTG
jgi:hypothetical protein